MVIWIRKSIWSSQRVSNYLGKVWQLCKALYGLKQASLSWWHTITKSMLALGFKRCKSDAGIYYYHDKKTKVLVIAIVYVDDVYFMGTKGSLLLNELKQKFMARWECHDLGETTEFLGMHISHDCKNQKIFIDQCEYLEKILVRFNCKGTTLVLLRLFGRVRIS